MAGLPGHPFCQGMDLLFSMGRAEERWSVEHRRGLAAALLLERLCVCGGSVCACAERCGAAHCEVGCDGDRS